MVNTAFLKDAATSLINELRRFIEAVESEEETASGAPVPAHLVNMPPETRDRRLAAGSVDASPPSNKTAAADAVKAASDESKTK